MNTYYEHLVSILKKTDKKYKYPGEMMEQCVMSGGRDKNQILEAFIRISGNEKQMEILSEFPDAFNTDQVDQFTRLFRNTEHAFDAQALRFDLSGEISLLSVDEISSVEMYVRLINYVSRVMEKAGREKTADLLEQIRKGIHFMYGNSFLGRRSGDYHRAVSFLETTLKEGFICWTKDEKKFIRLLCKAFDAPLRPEEAGQLENFGFDPLSSRRLNASAVRSGVIGRESRAVYEFLKQLLFGTVEAPDGDWELAEDLYYKHRELDRAIDQKKDLLALLLGNRFEDTSANIGEAFSFLMKKDKWGNPLVHATDIVHVFEKVGFGTLFSRLDAEQQKKVLSSRVEFYTLANKDIAADNIAQWKLHFPEEPVTALLTKDCLERLIRAELLPMETVMEENKDRIPWILYGLFEKPCKFTAKALEKYMREFGKLTSKPDQYTGVRFEGATDEQILELYSIKEKIFFRYMPEKYTDFIYDAILSTDEIVFTKEEVKELLPLLRLEGWRLEAVKKKLYSAEEYETMKQKEKEKAYEEDIQSQLVGISKAENIDKVGWYSLKIKDRRIADAYFKKASEDENLGSSRAMEHVVSLYTKDMIAEEEFFGYMRAHKNKIQEKKMEDNR